MSTPLEEALSQIARIFSASLDDAPAMVEAQREKLQETDRIRKRQAGELAQASGRAGRRADAAGNLYGTTNSGVWGKVFELTP